MKLSTKGRYGLRAMLDLASNADEGPRTIHAIAEETGNI
jgi:DNA-binding IscR family transcriptional regulator